MLSVILLLCTGCTTSVCRHYKAAPGTRSSSGKAVVAGIEGQNTGCFLFYSIPVWSGKPHRPNEKKWSMWRNYIRPRDMRKMLTARAKQLGADGIEDLHTEETSSGLWSLGILWTRSISAHCTAVKTTAAKNGTKRSRGK